MNRRFSLVLAIMAIATLFAFAGAADAAINFGKVRPATGFPRIVGDGTGKANQLQLCLDAAPFCEPTGVIAGNAQSEATGFGSEAAFYLATAQAVNPKGTQVRIRVEFALLATYANDLAIPRRTGTAIINSKFIDLRDVPPGNYTVLHPYGQDTLTVPAGGNATIIREVIGREVDGFAKAETGPVQFFLKAVTVSNPNYIGQMDVPRQVTGSALRNFVQITGPANANIGGPARSPNVLTIRTFGIEGKRASAPAAP